MYNVLIVLAASLLIIMGIAFRAEGEKKEPADARVPPAKNSGGLSSAGASAEVALPAPTPAGKAEIEKRLRELARTPAPDPKSLAYGAKCYDTGPPNMTDRAEFVCGKCSAKSLVALDHSEKIKEARRRAEAIRKKGLDVTIDDIGFCPKCSPEASGSLKASPEKNRIVIVVSYNGVPASRNVMEYMDLRLLEAFAGGSDRYANEQEREFALKGELQRLEKLLGVSAAGSDK